VAGARIPKSISSPPWATGFGFNSAQRGATSARVLHDGAKVFLLAIVVKRLQAPQMELLAVVNFSHRSSVRIR